MNSKTSESEKTLRDTPVAGHGSPLTTIHTVTLVINAFSNVVSLTSPEGHTIDLKAGHPVVLKTPICAKQTFCITIAPANESVLLPVMFRLDESGHVILTEEAADYGWHSESNLISIRNHLLAVALVFTGTGTGHKTQGIIIVGTVPTPEK